MDEYTIISTEMGTNKNNKNFWHNHNLDARRSTLKSYISKFNPQILSAYVEETYDPNCIPNKTAWLRKNTRLTDRSSKINLVRRKEKRNYATKGGQKNILIDDYIKNVREFTHKKINRNTSYKYISNTI